jgi:hypothetical protein
MSEGKLLCGQDKAFINVIDIEKFDSLNLFYLLGSGDINDITYTSEKEVYAFGCQEGLFIVKPNESTTLSAHHQGK